MYDCKTVTDRAAFSFGPVFAAPVFAYDACVFKNKQTKNYGYGGSHVQEVTVCYVGKM